MRREKVVTNYKEEGICQLFEWQVAALALPVAQPQVDAVVEERPADELRTLGGVSITPPDVPVWNPAFDVTPVKLITGWVTERGVWRPPFPPDGPLQEPVG